MCGIFGYAFWQRKTSVNEILQMLLSGLEKVEYRGYDSAGIAIDDTKERRDVSKPPSMIFIRSVGNISSLRATVEQEKKKNGIDDKKNVFQHVGIAHTRWATHGGVCLENCHPHQSNDGSFMVVHNGIMTNFLKKKEELQHLGYKFSSDTDTEVIAVLAEHLYKSLPPFSTFPTLMNALVRNIEGGYAILLKSTHFPDELIGYRNGSPLLIGARLHVPGANDDLPILQDSLETHPKVENVEVEVFFVSDFNSFLEKTKWAAYCSDGEMAHFAKGKLSFFEISSASSDEFTCIHRPFSLLDVNVAALSKGEYPTFMMKEVVEQRESTLATMRQRVDFARKKVSLDELKPEHVTRILSSHRIFFISCGTSYHSCLAVRPLIEELVMPVSVENASDFLDRKPRLDMQDTCIFVSQSGETADVLLAMKHCQQGNAFIIGVTNAQGSSVDRLTDCSLLLQCGPEVGVASTKAYTSQMVLLILFVLFITEKVESPEVQSRREEIILGFSHLPQKVSEAISVHMKEIETIAKRLLSASSIMVLGRGYDFSTALEAALKMKELSYLHTEGLNSGELKHGPLALVDGDLNVLCFCSKDKYFEKSLNALYQIQARGGKPIIITNEECEDLRSGEAREVLVFPKTVDCLQPIVNAIMGQLLAYYMAIHKGNNVDCPRNLAKSVTVE